MNRVEATQLHEIGDAADFLTIVAWLDKPSRDNEGVYRQHTRVVVLDQQRSTPTLRRAYDLLDTLVEMHALHAHDEGDLRAIFAELVSAVERY